MKLMINFQAIKNNLKISKIIRRTKILNTSGLLLTLAMLSTYGTISSDYVQAKTANSITVSNKQKEKTISDLINSNELLSLDEMTKAANGNGKFLTKGMKESSYIKAVNQEWVELETTGEPKKEIYEISKYYKWEDIEDFIKNLAKYEQSKLFIIGKTVEKRNIYALEIGTGSKTIVLTGSVHARETAGTSFILRQLSEFLSKSTTNNYYKKLLEEYKIVAVPCANPDGRVILEKNQSSYWKANANGIDLNRNLPSSDTGQLEKGYKQQPNYKTKPSSEFFPGYSLGSEPETKALISFFNKYVKETKVFLDYHQAGRVFYAGKYADVEDATNRSISLSKDLIDFMSKDGGYKYGLIKGTVGLEGIGNGSLTDYFSQLASGFEFSPAFGRLGLKTKNGIITMMMYKDLDKQLKYYKPINEEFACATLEIGTMDSRHYTKSARILQEKEYEKNNYDKMIVFLLERDYVNRYGKNQFEEFKKNSIKVEKGTIKR